MRTLPVVQPEVSPVLSESGLLLRGVFALPQLPDVVRAALHKHAPAAAEFSQLLLFAHAGPRMWQAMHRADPKPLTSPHPIDEFSMKVVRQHLEHELGVTRWAQLYPGPAPVPLQELGALLGWHAPSPLRVGINATFGTWFAYRALVAAAQPGAPTRPPRALPHLRRQAVPRRLPRLRPRQRDARARPLRHLPSPTRLPLRRPLPSTRGVPHSSAPPL
jgi:hypothetical protein